MHCLDIFTDLQYFRASSLIFFRYAISTKIREYTFLMKLCVNLADLQSCCSRPPVWWFSITSPSYSIQWNHIGQAGRLFIRRIRPLGCTIFSPHLGPGIHTRKLLGLLSCIPSPQQCSVFLSQAGNAILNKWLECSLTEQRHSQQHVFPAGCTKLV